MLSLLHVVWVLNFSEVILVILTGGRLSFDRFVLALP